MSDPAFLSVEDILCLHQEQIDDFGGSSEILDLGLLESAVDKATNRWLYDSNADIFDLAAAYTFGIAKNHPFADGNKRTALAAAIVFLSVNGITLDAPNEEIAEAVLALVTDEIDCDGFAELLFLRCWGEICKRESLKLSEEERSELIRLTENQSDECSRTIVIDAVTAKARSVLLERCELLKVEFARTEPFVRNAEAQLFQQVPIDLRRQFGMPVDPGE